MDKNDDRNITRMISMWQNNFPRPFKSQNSYFFLKRAGRFGGGIWFCQLTIRRSFLLILLANAPHIFFYTLVYWEGGVNGYKCPVKPYFGGAPLCHHPLPPQCAHGHYVFFLRQKKPPVIPTLKKAWIHSIEGGPFSRRRAAPRVAPVSMQPVSMRFRATLRA